MSTPILRYVTPRTNMVEPSYLHMYFRSRIWITPSKFTPAKYVLFDSRPIILAPPIAYLLNGYLGRTPRQVVGPRAVCLFISSLDASSHLAIAPTCQDHRDSGCHVFTSERRRAVCNGQWKRALCVVGTNRLGVTVLLSVPFRPVERHAPASYLYKSTFPTIIQTYLGRVIKISFQWNYCASVVPPSHMHL